MLDQTQGTTIIPSLTALESHPDFQRGIADARKRFLEDYEPTPLTEDQMIEEIETELSRCVIERSKMVMLEYGERLSYFYNLGYVFGTINKGLAYASTPC